MQQLIFVVLTLGHLVYSVPVTNNIAYNYEEHELSSAISTNDIAIYNYSTNVRPYYDYYAAIDPEARMTIEEMIRYHGYPIEVHTVETEDGYELTIHRVPYGKKGNDGTPRKPVLIQHGIFCTSASWVSNPPDKNLPYILADLGYDVWLGNIRGTAFGRKHKKYTPQQKEFWAFSFQEMAKYDLPKIIDMILSKSGFKHIHYIGHSMGTTMAFAMLSTQPKYNDKIKGFYAFAPVATMAEVRSPIRIITPFIKQLDWVLHNLGPGELLGTSKLMKLFTTTVCNSPLKAVCENILFLLCGYNPKQLNSTRLPVYLHFTPAATSVRNLVHYSQMVNSKKFHKYDHGITTNQKVYGQTKPPDFNLQNIKTPVALFWGENDWLADPSDVSWLASRLPSLILKYRVPEKSFAHMDFLWAIDAKDLLFNRLISVMDKLWPD